MISRSDKILFQGDSITDAFRRPEEVNLSFQLGAGYVFLVASQLLADYPSAGLTFVNRGVSGDTVGKLLQRWTEDFVRVSPNVISILVGINDILYGTSASQTARNYECLMERIARELPATKVVLMEPYVLSNAALTANQHSDLAACQATVRSLAKECGAVFVPLQDQLNEVSARAENPQHYSYDGIHASPAGAATLARAWLEAVFRKQSAITLL